MNKTYKLVNRKEENKIVSRLKKSFLLEDIGIKSNNFKSKIMLSTLVVISAMSLMYYLWRV